MSKSLEHLDLFRDDSDRELFMTLLDQKMSKYDCHCYAYTLMRNHYHLILRPSASNISKLMQSINSTYAVYYNGKYNRKGYLFFDRFKSISTGSPDYLKNLIYYTHANPLRAGFVEYMDFIRSRIGRDAMRLFSHRTINGLGYSGSFVGRLLGVDSTTILRAAEKGRELAYNVKFPLFADSSDVVIPKFL